MRLRFPPIEQPGVIYDGHSPYRRLALAVILRAMADLDGCEPDSEEYISAHDWVYGEEEDGLPFSTCCALNNLDMNHVREYLSRTDRKRYRIKQR